jgi:hypothetical protein
MKNRLRRVLVGLALLAWTAAAAAQIRPTVAVSFDLAVPRWQAHFGDERAMFEKQAAGRIAKWLGEHFGFLSFAADASSTPALVVHLEVAPGQSVRQNKETQLRLELAGTGAPAPLVWRFRPEDKFAEPTGGLPGLLKELELRLEEVNRQALVAQILSQVSIAKEARLWQSPVSWVIPYRKTDLCMDLSSVLRIVSMMPSGAGPQQRIYRARAKGEFRPQGATPPADWIGRVFTVPETSTPPEEAETGLNALGSVNPQQVSIQAIYVLEYQRLQPCVGAASPATVDFRGGTR